MIRTRSITDHSMLRLTQIALEKHFGKMTEFGIAKKEEEPEIIPIHEMFVAFCQMDPLSDAMGVQLLPLSQSDKWLTKARLLDMHKITSTETGFLFFKFRRRAIGYEDYLTYLEDLADKTGLKLDEMKYAMQTCGKPIHPRDLKKKKR